MKLFVLTNAGEIVKVLRAGHTIYGENMVLTQREVDSTRMYKFVGPNNSYKMLCDEHGKEVVYDKSSKCYN